MNCPSCAAPFQWFDRFAELVVCGSCQATCLVDGASLEVKGKMAVLAPPEGVFSLGAMGTIRGKNFTVVGRVRYAYERGVWDEWFLLFDDGSQRWISEDEDRLQISRLKKKRIPTKRFIDAAPGSYVTIDAERYHVNEKGVAECVGGEGQLPFVVEPGEETPFLDIRHGSKSTGTVEFTEDGDVRLYLGAFLDKSEIDIAVQGTQYGSAAVDGATKAKFVQASTDKPESFNCYACGGALAAGSEECEYCGTANTPATAHVDCPECSMRFALPAGNAALTLTCPGCHTAFEESGKILSAQDATLQPTNALLKVGHRGVIDRTEYVVTGWIYSRGVESGWGFSTWEYMLYSPKVGYRWLVCCDGHYSFTKPIPPVGEDAAETLRNGAVGDSLSHDGRKFKVSGRGKSTIRWVEGQLPYVAKVNDTTKYCDAAKAPYLLSMEKSAGEVEYFQARYMHRHEVADSFNLDLNDVADPDENAAHQPYPISPFRKQALVCMLVFLLVNLWLIIESNPSGWLIQDFVYEAPQWSGEVLSEPFVVSQDDTVARVVATTSVNNDWVYVDLGLLDAQNKVIHEFGSTIQYYHGVDGGESWSEGNRFHEFHMKIPKAGNYRLIMMGQSQTYRGNIGLEISERCTLNGMTWILFLGCVFWIGLEILIWMNFKGYLDEDD